MFLDHRDDLLSLASADDHAVFDELVEWLLIKIVPKRFAACVWKLHSPKHPKCLLTECDFRFCLQRFLMPAPLYSINKSSARLDLDLFAEQKKPDDSRPY